jgi:hypothetical protein
MRTLVWNADDVVDVYASMFRDARPYDFMDMPRDQRGFMYADKVIQNGKVSRAVEFHRRALAEPDVRLAPHPAPIVRPRP